VGSLSDVQQQVIIGCVLGDGYMRKKTHAHLQVTHSIKQKDYVDWKYKVLNNLVIKPPSAYKGNGIRIGYRFFTRNLPVLTPIHDLFYSNGVKIVPDHLILTPLSIAVWYMDDGSKSYRSCYFNSQKLDLKSQNNLMDSLSRFGVKSNLNKDKSYFRIRVTTSSTPKLLAMISPHIIKSMRYKIPI
jgi:hypothetical protein